MENTSACVILCVFDIEQVIPQVIGRLQTRGKLPGTWDPHPLRTFVLFYFSKTFDLLETAPHALTSKRQQRCKTWSRRHAHVAGNVNSQRLLLLLLWVGHTDHGGNAFAVLHPPYRLNRNTTVPVVRYVEGTWAVVESVWNCGKSCQHSSNCKGGYDIFLVNLAQIIN